MLAERRPQDGARARRPRDPRQVIAEEPRRTRDEPRRQPPTVAMAHFVTGGREAACRPRALRSRTPAATPAGPGPASASCARVPAMAFPPRPQGEEEDALPSSHPLAGITGGGLRGAPRAPRGDRPHGGDAGQPPGRRSALWTLPRRRPIRVPRGLRPHPAPGGPTRPPPSRSSGRISPAAPFSRPESPTGTSAPATARRAAVKRSRPAASRAPSRARPSSPRGPARSWIGPMARGWRRSGPARGSDGARGGPRPGEDREV